MSVLAPVWAPVAAAQDDAPLARADSLYAAFDNAGALEIYEELYGRDSTDFELLYRLSRTAGEFAKDILAEEGAKAARPLMEQSVSYAERLRQFHPDRPETWFQLAVTWGTLARTQDGRDKVRLGREVEEFAKQAIRRDPNYAYAHLALGIFYREVGGLNWIQRTFANTFYGGLPEGGFDRALKELRTALELDPTLVMTHYELAVTYLAVDDMPMARYHLGRAKSLTPINTEELRQQAEAARLLRELDNDDG